MEQASDFQSLPLARTQMPAALVGQYRLYTDAKNYKRIEADSAVSALELSGLQNVIRIERESLSKASLITPNFEKPVLAEAAPESPPAN